MRKDKLISLLQQIKGNPDIVLWNGLVQDWVDISPQLIEGSLVKMGKEYYKESVRIERCVSKSDLQLQLPPDEIKELDMLYKKFKWEYNEVVSEADIKSGRYKQKKVLFIDAKLKNETHYDRLGSVNY